MATLKCWTTAPYFFVGFRSTLEIDSFAYISWMMIRKSIEEKPFSRYWCVCGRERRMFLSDLLARETFNIDGKSERFRTN